MINQGKATIKPKYGVMNLFGYGSLNIKRQITIYDRFIYLYSRAAKGGFYGINFHYLQFRCKSSIFKTTIKFASDKNFDKKTRYNIGELSGRYFKKTIKHYLFKTSENIIFKYNSR